MMKKFNNIKKDMLMVGGGSQNMADSRLVLLIYTTSWQNTN